MSHLLILQPPLAFGLTAMASEAAYDELWEWRDLETAKYSGKY